MKILIAILATLVITSLCWYYATRMINGAEELWLISAIKVPVQMAVDDMATELERGHVATATAKLKILQAEWNRFDTEGKIGGPGIGDLMVEFSRVPAPENEK